MFDHRKFAGIVGNEQSLFSGASIRAFISTDNRQFLAGKLNLDF